MNYTLSNLSATRLKRIREQGYFQHSDSEISALAWGNRFAYILCTSILIIGVSAANIPILTVMMSVAFLGFILPNHPFDYIYNYWIAQLINRPKLPPRSKQLKFACKAATAHIAATIIFFALGYTLAGYIFGAVLISVASLVSTIDLCIPSIMYNALLKDKS